MKCVAVVKQGKWGVRGDWLCLFDRGQREGLNKMGWWVLINFGVGW